MAAMSLKEGRLRAEKDCQSKVKFKAIFGELLKYSFLFTAELAAPSHFLF